MNGPSKVGKRHAYFCVSCKCLQRDRSLHKKQLTGKVNWKIFTLKKGSLILILPTAYVMSPLKVNQL